MVGPHKREGPGLSRHVADFFNLLSPFHSLSNVTFHVARFLSASLYASNTRYNGVHLFGGSYGHANHRDTAWSHPAPR